MKPFSRDCCVLNGGSGAWAFDPLALQLAASLGVEISQTPRRFNYLLNFEDVDRLADCNLFIPLDSIRLASDKRILARVFQEHDVPIPSTQLFDTFAEAVHFVEMNPNQEWCLKYPTGCGGSGHRVLDHSSVEPPNWPRPFIVQEFIKMERPEVYRMFCAAGETFGWIVRRFPEGSRASPWVAHARGARYVKLSEPPEGALETAARALKATRLWDSFGCVDLLLTPTGKWVALEVGTDGLFNHVDRELGNFDSEQDLTRHVAEAFWSKAAVEFK